MPINIVARDMLRCIHCAGTTTGVRNNITNYYDRAAYSANFEQLDNDSTGVSTVRGEFAPESVRVDPGFNRRRLPNYSTTLLFNAAE